MAYYRVWLWLFFVERFAVLIRIYAANNCVFHCYFGICLLKSRIHKDKTSRLSYFMCKAYIIYVSVSQIRVYLSSPSYDSVRSSSAWTQCHIADTLVCHPFWLSFTLKRFGHWGTFCLPLNADSYNKGSQNKQFCLWPPAVNSWGWVGWVIIV